MYVERRWAARSGAALLLKHQAQDYWCAQRGTCSNRGMVGQGTSDDDLRHLWLVVVVSWLTAAIVGVVFSWLGQIRFIRNVGLALIAGRRQGG